MDEGGIRQVLQRIGVPDLRITHDGWLNGTCPLARWTHQRGRDRRPSFGVKVETDGVSGYKCQACGHKGTLVGLLSKIKMYSGADTEPLIDWVKAREARGEELPPYGVRTQSEDMTPPEPVMEEAYEDLFPPASEVGAAVQYLASRGISPETADKLGLLYDDEPHGDRTTPENRILFPVRDRAGSLYGFTGRTINPNVQPKIRDYAGLPKRKLLLGEHLWSNDKPPFLVEGLFGYAHLHQIGADQYFDIAATLGAELHPMQRARVLAHPSARAYLMFDFDEAGDKALFGPVLPEPNSYTGEPSREWSKGAIGQLIDHIMVFVPDWPDGKDDPDQLTLDEVRHIKATLAPYMGKLGA